MPADDLCESWFKSLSAESAEWPVPAPIRSNFLKLQHGTGAPTVQFFYDKLPYCATSNFNTCHYN